MIFKDRKRKEPYKRKITYADGRTEIVTIEEMDGNVTETGTPLNSINMNKLVQSEGENFNNKNLDTLGGKFHFGYGDGLTNSPFPYAFVLNIPHPTSSKDNAQLTFNILNGKMANRKQRSGNWDDWQQITTDNRFEIKKGEKVVAPRQIQSGYITSGASTLDTTIILDKYYDKIVPKIVSGYLRIRKGTGDYLTDFQQISLASQNIININFPFAPTANSNILLMRITRKDGSPFDGPNNICLSVDLQDVVLQF